MRYDVLKKIKELQGSSESVTTSSGKLAKIIGMSQQSSSRIIIGLVRSGYIVRDFERRMQRLRVTELGLKVLYEEVVSLNRALGLMSLVKIAGSVFSGLGEGKYYLSREGYKIQFVEKLGYVPFAGTLNLKVMKNDWNKLVLLRQSPGIHIDGFSAEGRSFGPVKAFPARIEGISGAIIMPERTVYTDVMEAISSEYLREKLHLKDGSVVTAEIRI